jgi:DNA-binding beta-propeller fold protein YncE
MKRSVVGLTAGCAAVWVWLAFFSATGWRGGAPGYSRLAFAQEHGAARTVNFDKLVENVPVGGVQAVRCVFDPYAEFNGVAVDPVNDLVVMSAPNIRAIMLYRRTSGGNSGEVTQPLGELTGPATQMSGMSAVAVDPVRKQFYAVETDIGNNVGVFSYNDRGDAKPRTLITPVGSWGIALSPARDQMVVSIEENDELMVFPREAKGIDKPLRQIRGLHTTLADPKGLAWDEKNHEIVSANVGNWSRSYWDPDYTGGGEYRPPSVVVFDETADKDARPKRVIQGDKTGLDFPHGLVVDNVHDEIAVANDGGNSVLIFSRTANGNVPPIRVIKGPHTEVERPMGVALDMTNDELWVANWGHSAEVFDRSASGDATPKRIIRSAPPGTPAAGIALPEDVTLDTKRDQLLVPI